MVSPNQVVVVEFVLYVTTKEGERVVGMPFRLIVKGCRKKTFFSEKSTEEFCLKNKRGREVVINF